ncbi:MAG TPA: SPFH domain-containing protein [Longimicrobiales bacterium]|nr:SPFH domain-containing protein [Longimicrobiales bacterium]
MDIPVLGELGSLGVIIGGVLVAAFGLAMYTIKRLIVIVPPNQAAVITGRRRALDDGTQIGYRTVTGGRTLRVPIIEEVQWMSLGTLPLEISVSDAYSKGNIPLEVKAVANLKIASAPDSVFNNAVERLLGKRMPEIEGLARETLTGNLRGVLAKLTPEEVNEDRLGFARHLSEEADHDLKKLGLQLDVLKIQHVSDRVGYLKAMGEKATAEAIRDAEIAKAQAQAETAQKRAEAQRVAEVANAQAAVAISEAQNLLRVRQAELSREAETAERVARADAERAEAQARTQLEAQRVELERTRLQADVVQVAEADRMAAEARAKAAAAPILENGRAQAEALRMLLLEIQKSGEAGLRVFIAEKLPGLLAHALDAMRDIDIERVTVVDSGSGQGVANATTQKVNASLIALQQVAGAMGLDLDAFVKGLSRAAIPASVDK